MSESIALMRRTFGGTIRSKEVLARKLTLEDNEIVDRFIVEVEQPICRHDSELMGTIMRLWRSRDPQKVCLENFVDTTRFSDLETCRHFLKENIEYGQDNPKYLKALRDRNIRMCKWFDKCFPGHDRWEVLKLSCPTRNLRVKVKRKPRTSNESTTF